MDITWVLHVSDAKPEKLISSELELLTGCNLFLGLSLDIKHLYSILPQFFLFIIFSNIFFIII